MNVINHRQFQKRSGGKKRPIHHHVVRSLLILIGLFVVANIGMMMLYHDKVLPNQTIGGLAVGKARYADAERLLRAYELPRTILIEKNGYAEEVPVAQLDISVDVPKTMAELKRKPIVPVLSLVQKKERPLVFTADYDKIADSILVLDAVFSRAATDKRVSFNGNDFYVESAKSGYTFDADATARRIVAQLALGKRTVAAATSSTPAGSNTGDFTKEKNELERQVQTKITYIAGNQKIQPTKSDLGGLYEHKDRTMILSDAKLSSYIAEVERKMGITPLNSKEAALATKYALEKKQSLSFVFSNPGVKKYTYCAAVRGVDTTVVPELEQKLAATFNDPRGWNASGRVAFVQVADGCNFTVWLTAPAQMASFGAICDEYYSCNVGSNVVVNYDRWQGATDPWNKQHLGIEEYRAMAINHETGHWLGYGHAPCRTPGQPAPVMMQQSIDLGGCSFNAWPVQKELEDVL